ncbi:MAG: dynamin family protein [Scytonema sp. PMC 1069.18]|nr:dynamin family protein [Scytonema sp. PMC 1069.18]MEC4880168.1 dynamin family protein [Scytonema sp. PMC 1070.18]
MFSQEFQATYQEIKTTGERLLQYLREFRASRIREGDDTKGLQSVENDIVNAINALKAQKYQVAVIAPMKAGKSTFLNALIGADILASETAACTVCRTDILHIDSGKPQLLEYRVGQKQPAVIAEGDAGEIVHKFLDRTHEIRDRANPDRVKYFELRHPIEAISRYPSLAGFTLVDTPGPNEWKTASFDTTSLKETALEALRTCDAILFLLDYTSFRDEAASDLFKELLENRKEFLVENTGKIFFILNKVDMHSEKDRPISDVITGIKRDLIKFGFSNPVIYPVSARKGLWAKLIMQGSATDSVKKDFRKFFGGAYAEEDEEGGSYIPPNSKIAPKALEDSKIPAIENTVIQTIIQNSGWNLLDGVCGKLDKAAKAIEDKLNTEIRGWEIELKDLQAKIEEYKRRSELARSKVENVKNFVKKKEQELIERFSQEIAHFAEQAKHRIQALFDRFAESRKAKNPLSDPLGWVKQSIDSFFQQVLPFVFDSAKSGSDPYKIQVYNKSEAQEIWKAINTFCRPVIKDWWVDTQARLIRDGTQIQKELASEIQSQIQAISNELSSYLKESLEIKLNPNPIQFPSFELPTIDDQIQRQQEAYTRYKNVTKYRNETRYKTKSRKVEGGFCESDRYENYEDPYTVQVPYTDTIGKTAYRDLYEVDLRQTAQAFKDKIDEQVVGSREMLQRVVEKQVITHFRGAEQQINDYINKFQADFDQLLVERETKEAKAEQIRQSLEAEKVVLDSHIQNLGTIGKSLQAWKPRQ